MGAEVGGGRVDVLRGQGQGDTGGRDHRRLQGLQGEVRVDEQGRAYVIIMLDTEPGQNQKILDSSFRFKHFFAFYEYFLTI